MATLLKMMTNLSAPVIRSNGRRQLCLSHWNRRTFEPDYLYSAVPPIPTYPPINIQLRGFDYSVLEAAQSCVHKFADNMGIDVEDSWITPAKSYKISTYQAGGTRVKNEFSLNIYERNVQVVNLRSVDAPLLLDTVRAILPEGVQLSIHEHQQEHFEERFIPDPFINSIRQELEESAEKMEAEKAEREALSAVKTARKQEKLLKSFEEGDD